MRTPVALRAEIDLEAVRHNVRALPAAPDDELMGVVKADAYGHGAVPVARVLEAEGVKRLAVATVPEAVELRDAGIESRILVLAGPLPEFLPVYAEHGLEAVVSSSTVAEAVAEYRIPVHVKVDTGMHRLGVQPEQAPSTIKRLLEAGVPVEAVWTHLATADAEDSSFVLEQVQQFDAAIADLEDGILVHVANGPAHVRLPRVTSRPALVRLGGVLYGLGSDDAMAPSMTHLRPAMRLVARVVNILIVQAGETVSYGRTWTAPRPTRIATLGIGYADGLPRSLSN
ncbi:alanine racemase, partial [Rubrivirga sp.]|uniref:alanine racemase n=1 Tax=Rubrivirga sp. TaxID=1885344 RepID=UPI003C745F37